MDDKANRSKKPKQRQWEWHSNIYDLKTTSNDLTQIWNCSPYVMICAGKSNSDEDPEININIEMNRNFKWNEAVGWNWHKSWNIPTLTVSFSVASTQQIFDKITMQEIEPPVNLIAQLYIAKLATNANSTIYFVDVPVKGVTSQNIVDGRAVFEGLKFESTSYNHHGSKFHIMILIAFRDDAAQNGAPKIIFSRISPPIYVDSRIAAREKKAHVFVPTAVPKESADGSLSCELFDPHLLMKEYFKKVKGKGKKEEETKIENDLKGIYDYLTAPNIRKKTKSILFFLLRFSKCIKIHLPKEPFQSLSKKDILADIYRAVVGQPGAPLYLYLCGEPTIQAFEYIKVAFQEIKQLIKERITITLDTDNIPKDYFQAELGENYFMTYSELFISNHTAAPEPKSDFEEESDEGDAPDKESNIEELFQINKEMLEREYNLTTLNLEKIAMVNFKEILSRANKQINDEDIVLPTERDMLEGLGKRELPSQPSLLDLKSLLSDPDGFQKKIFQAGLPDAFQKPSGSLLQLMPSSSLPNIPAYGLFDPQLSSDKDAASLMNSFIPAQLKSVLTGKLHASLASINDQQPQRQPPALASQPSALMNSKPTARPSEECSDVFVSDSDGL